MRRALSRERSYGDDLPALDVDDFGVAVVEPRPQRPPWVQVAGLALAAIAVGALVVIAWEQRDQDRLARHQACILNAQFVNNSLGGPPDTAALAKCFPPPTPAPEVVVPGVNSMHVGDAMTALSRAGLEGRVTSGPGGNDPVVVGQAPRAGAKVPQGTEVNLTTTAS